MASKTAKGAKKPKMQADQQYVTAYDWGGEKLTEKQKQFVFYFTWPGQDGFHCAMRAARKAGYTAATANVYSCKMLRDPKIKKLIQKYESEARSSIHDAAQRFIQEKIIRADYNVKDFFDVESGYSEKTGKPWRVFSPKDPADLTDEQLLCIENIQTGQGASNIVFADRQKERDSIIALDKSWNGAGNGVGQDAEEIREVIIERVTMRQEKRIKTMETVDYEIIDVPEGLEGEEL
jgi:hypothetical protein